MKNQASLILEITYKTVFLVKRNHYLSFIRLYMHASLVSFLENRTSLGISNNLEDGAAIKYIFDFVKCRKVQQSKI